MPVGLIEQYLGTIRAVRSTGQATGEQSYYPAVFTLLDGLGSMSQVRRKALAQPAGINGRFPDVALYEVASNVLVLPVEVKAANASMATLLASGQALSYAQTFGGGYVLLTNLREWVLAVIDDGTGMLVEADRVTLAATENDLDAANPTIATNALDRLRGMIETGCQVRGANKSPKVVASLLAYHARQMRDAINDAGDPAELLASINDALAKGLQIELDADMLTPTVVQTLVYGSFAAWLGVEEPTRFNWMHASYRLSVPVFAEILHGALSPNLLRKCDLTGHLEAVARVLSWTDRDTFVSHFDGDAIQYFYEPFLAEFDPTLRDALGVWYTPTEIARYQVARADHHLRTDLNIADGLADTRVYVLDPATGTGTYLIACIDFIYDFHRNNGEPDTIAAQRAWEAATTRFIGFEILPAAFIICHLHLTRHLQQLGAAPSDKRLRVYLTNSLTGWDENSSPQGMTLFPELETELHDAAVAKHTDPVIVVLGNPPYQGYSSAETAEERALIEPWAKALTTDWGLRKHRLNDLYVRFWRISIERIVEITGHGVVSFITNRKWLGGRSYPSMREAIVTNFDTIWVDDLHGDVHDASHAGDQSVFTTTVAAGIRVGTAIVTAVRTETAADTSPANVHLHDYRGTANHKRALLDARRGPTMNDDYAPVTATKASRYRFVADAGNDFPALDEYLPEYHSGVQPVGEAVIDRDKARLEHRMGEYFDDTLDLTQVTALHPGFGKTRSGYDPAKTRRTLLPGGYNSAKITRFIFRPFDSRWLYWEPTTKLLNRSRPELVPYWRNVSGGQTCLIAPQTTRRVGAARPYASNAVAGFDAVDPNARVFPLYTPDMLTLGEDNGELGLDLNTTTAPTTVAPEWVTAAKTTLAITDDQAAGEAIFYALIAITHSNDWLADQPVDHDDFPTIPLPADKTTFEDAITVGKELLALLDPDQPVTGVTQGQIRTNLRDLALPDQVAGHVDITVGSAGIRAGNRTGTDVLWDTTHGWHDIPDDVWHYTVGGFQVLPKWLSYRMQHLSPQDRETFRILCRRIQAILDLSTRCNTLYANARTNPLTQPTPQT